MKINGEWIGYYEFGIDYPPPRFGERVNFRLRIEEDGDQFYGTCEEEVSEFSINEISNITGFVEENVISFIKSYQHTYFAEEDGTTVKEGSPMEISYSGTYDKKTDSWFGEWIIEVEGYDENGKNVQYVSSGLWKIVRRD